MARRWMRNRRAEQHDSPGGISSLSDRICGSVGTDADVCPVSADRGHVRIAVGGDEPVHPWLHYRVLDHLADHDARAGGKGDVLSLDVELDPFGRIEGYVGGIYQVVVHRVVELANVFHRPGSQKKGAKVLWIRIIHAPFILDERVVRLVLRL